MTGKRTEDTMIHGRRLHVLFERKGDTFVATCPELMITCEGSSMDTARKNIERAVFSSHDPYISPEATSGEVSLADIEQLDQTLATHFGDRIRVDAKLTRSHVSYQASKTQASYRWYKFKEAFSPSLVQYLLKEWGIGSGTLLDPFAGSGTALFAASALGLDADGIELLPIGHEVINARLRLESILINDDFNTLKRWLVTQPWKNAEEIEPLATLRITSGAYPVETQQAIERYLGAGKRENDNVRSVLRFALLCIVESVSYTRKDGQYLRWDHRSGRRQGSKPFHKGTIPTFDQAITAKLEQILFDVQNEIQSLILPTGRVGNIRLLKGSCFSLLPELPAEYYDVLITSPPYCNRYDYTRTYALELAVLGIRESELSDLRQHMLSCTVENRAKNMLSMNPDWARPLEVADRQQLLQGILAYLAAQKAEGKLNNNGIPRMVRGYFYEMACVIAECARVLKPGARLFMVNDNVRYAGASISVDLILSDMAEALGFHVENILVLPNGKGNSSQQMGKHGRQPLRKSVYVWRKK